MAITAAPSPAHRAARPEAARQQRTGRAAAHRHSASERPFGSSQAKSHPAAGATVANAFQGSGRPLPWGMQQRHGATLGADFTGVRLHDDRAAADAARSLQAHAFTAGDRIALGSRAWAPDTPFGERLIAHELAHVVQQRLHAPLPGAALSRRDDPAEHEADMAADLMVRGLPAPPLVQRAARVSLFPYQTVGTTLDRTNIGTLTGLSYWVQRTGDQFALTQSPRMAADPEEQSAVLAALWASNPPAPVTAHSERIVPIDPRPAPPTPAGSPTAATPPAAPPALLYRFKFDPPAAPGGKPRLECEFIAAGPGAVPVAATTPAAGFTPGTLNAGSAGFPSPGRAAYFTAHPAEFAQLMNVIAAAPPSLDQYLTTATTNPQGTVTHTSLLHVVRPAPSGGLDVDLVAERAPLAAAGAPPDYLTRDASDFEIEKLQSPSRTAANRLGTVTLPPGLTPAEHLAVNLAIQTYFENNARRTEVDAIVPVGATGTATVLFTLRFGTGNAVTVERIGPAGAGAGTVGTARIDVSRIDVSRIAGFPGATATDAALRAWWTARYPGGGALTTPAPAAIPSGPTPSGATPAAASTATLIGEMNALIAAGVTGTAWFTGSYGIEPLAAGAAATRLRDVHHAPAGIHPTLGTLADGTKAFSTADLLLLELALETASTTVLAALRGVKLIRMTDAITRNSSGTWQSDPGNTYGITVHDGSERSTLLFDRFTLGDDALFRGSTAANALPGSTMAILHELGHAAGSQSGVETAFDAWRAAHPQAAQTWYAASGSSEVFPEAFALFQTDPHFLCGSAPLLYAWFLEWTTSGTPPGASATLHAPTTCPP